MSPGASPESWGFHSLRWLRGFLPAEKVPYARWGVLRLGAELAGGETDLHLVAAREWYEKQPALLPSADPSQRSLIDEPL